MADWLKTHSNRGNENNEEFDNSDWARELAQYDDSTNEIPSDAGTEMTRPADSVTGPRKSNPNPNGRATCTFEGCGKTFGRTHHLDRQDGSITLPAV